MELLCVISSAYFHDEQWDIVVKQGQGLMYTMVLYTFDDDFVPLDEVSETIADFVKKQRLKIITGEYPEHTEMKLPVSPRVGGLTHHIYRLTKKGWKDIANI